MNPHKVLGRRFVAFLLDGLILTAINLAIYFPMAEKQDDIVADVLAGDSDVTSTYVNIGDYSLTGGTAALYMLATLVIALLYWVVLVGRTGWSPGKLALGLRVVRDDGVTPPGMGRALGRHFLWIADMFPYVIPGLTGLLVALTNDRRKRLGDMVAKTAVVKAGAALEAAGRPGGDHEPSAGGDAAPPVMGTQAMPAIPASRPEPPPQPQAPSGPPADWYPDPHGEKRLRYWDGASWTGHTAD